MVFQSRIAPDHRSSSILRSMLPITARLVTKFILRPADIARMFQTVSLSCDISLLENYVRQGEQSEKSTGAVSHETRKAFTVFTWARNCFVLDQGKPVLI
jgi:hypothetical protein